MAEKLEWVQCEVCGKICNVVEAYIHWKCIGHNNWRIISLKEKDEHQD